MGHEHDAKSMPPPIGRWASKNCGQQGRPMSHSGPPPSAY